MWTASQRSCPGLRLCSQEGEAHPDGERLRADVAPAVGDERGDEHGGRCGCKVHGVKQGAGGARDPGKLFDQWCHGHICASLGTFQGPYGKGLETRKAGDPICIGLGFAGLN